MRSLLVHMILLCACLFLSNRPMAQARPPEERRVIEAQRMEEYRTQRAFRYEETPPARNGFWERIWMWVFQQLERLLSGKTASRVVDVLKWLIPAFVIAYAFYRILGMEHVSPWRARTSDAQAVSDPARENIHALDFDASIARALAEDHYREAVRLQYLRVLKQLADNGRIQWRPGKTNADYLAEVSGTALSGGFAELTHIYECAWYGELPVSPEAYANIEPGFRGFRERIPT